MREIGIRGFISFTENATATDEDIIYPSRTDRLDYEGEIAVVIGKKGKDIKVANAQEYFWGYMLMNDVSARTALPTMDNPGSRFARDKNFDTSTCAGPYVVVGELVDPQNVNWETRVNGEVRQRGNTKDMAFSFAELLEHLSEDMTFYPGDVISAGTTGGTATDSSPFLPAEGGARPQKDPRLFLKVGDSVEVSNPVLGVLRNQVVAKR
jgi:2-keto-4-pentenoate hydratase/2-oxohepta-3-ene-1,7-dioic acid hydratase in catechol pathway